MLKINYFFSNIFIKVLLLFLIVSLMGLSTTFQYQRFVTLGFIPFIFLFLIIKNKFAFKSLRNNYINIYIIIIIISVVLIFVSIDFTIAFENIIQLFGVLLSSIIILEILELKNTNILNWIFISFIIGFYISAYFFFNDLGSDINLETKWIPRDVYDLNANKYSYNSFIANIAALYLIELTSKKRFIILSFLTIILGVYISFFTASRSGFIFPLTAVIVYWLFIYDKTKKTFRYVKTFTVLALVLYLSQFVYSIYSNSYLKERVTRSNEVGDVRDDLALDAINVFLDNPFMGLGPGQYSVYNVFHDNIYTHNSYLEAATNLGIFGFIAICFLFFKPLISSLKKKTYNFSSLRKLTLLYFFLFMLYNNFYVFYWSVSEMMFFFLCTWVLEKKVK